MVNGIMSLHSHLFIGNLFHRWIRNSVWGNRYSTQRPFLFYSFRDLLFSSSYFLTVVGVIKTTSLCSKSLTTSRLKERSIRFVDKQRRNCHNNSVYLPLQYTGFIYETTLSPFYTYYWWQCLHLSPNCDSVFNNISSTVVETDIVQN